MSVGIDIGSKTIKVVELDNSSGKHTLKSAAVVGYRGIELEKLTDEKEMISLSQAIRKLLTDAKISKKEVSISLPDSQTYTRLIKFPLLTDQEIASAVKWEAEQYIPFPIKEAVVQHKVIQRHENATPPEVSVLLVAAPRVLVEKYAKVASLAKLNLAFAETAMLASARSLGIPGKATMVMDMGARSTNIAVADGENLVFSRSIPTAGDALTRSIAQSFGIQSDQAEQYKKTYGLELNQLEGKVAAALTPMITIIAQEIKKAIHYYQTEEKGTPPTNLFLTGGSAGMKQVATQLTKLIGIEVDIANPFSKISVDQNTAKALAGYAPLYSTAVGLAMREK